MKTSNAPTHKVNPGSGSAITRSPLKDQLKAGSGAINTAREGKGK